MTDAGLWVKIGRVCAAVSEPYVDKLEVNMRAKAQGPTVIVGFEKEIALHRWYNNNLHCAPKLVIFAVQGRYEEAEPVRVAAVYGSNLPVAWSFMLALRARGLSTCRPSVADWLHWERW